MIKQSVKLWLLTSLKGILAIIFGLIALFNNELSQKAFAILFGIFVLVTGLILTATAIRNRHHYNWRHWLFEGIFDLLIGIMILIFPKITFAILIAIFGIWALFMGLLLLLTYYRLKESRLTSNIYLYLSLFSMLLGIIFLWNPFTSGAVVISLIGIFAIAYGIITIIKTYRLTRMQ
jgi:uncharacterized membrane protein HdeD (DUF308 family)